MLQRHALHWQDFSHQEGLQLACHPKLLKGTLATTATCLSNRRDQDRSTPRYGSAPLRGVLPHSGDISVKPFPNCSTSVLLGLSVRLLALTHPKTASRHLFMVTMTTPRSSGIRRVVLPNPSPSAGYPPVQPRLFQSHNQVRLE